MSRGFVVVDLDRTLGAFEESYSATGRGQWDALVIQTQEGIDEIPNGAGWEMDFTVWDSYPDVVNWAKKNLKGKVNPVTGHVFRYQIMRYEEWGKQLQIQLNHLKRISRL